jgi:hypothetical protein
MAGAIVLHVRLAIARVSASDIFCGRFISLLRKGLLQQIGREINFA